MKKCLLCNLVTVFYKKVDQISINECSYCKLACTINPPNTKNLYKDDRYYSLKQYLPIKSKQFKKFLSISKKIKQIIKKGKILEVGAGHGLFT